MLARLGAGGMGEVFLGHDPRLQRRVALKCVSSADTENPDARARILREARAAARLKHHNIAAVYDVLEQDGRTFIVMEYVDGESLASRLARGRLDLEQVRVIGRQLASALAAAHAQGVIHRDLKPANIHFDGDRSIKVLDFGVAKVASRAAANPDAATSPPTSEMTITGSPGTVSYMSPEQLFGTEVDGRSDIYSAGVILFEMATGRRPFDPKGAVPLALAMSHNDAPPMQSLNPQAPDDFSAVVAKALARDPDERYQTAMELEAALVQCGAPPPSVTTVRMQDTRESRDMRPAAPPAGPARAPSRRAVGLVLAIAIALSAAAGAVLLKTRTQPAASARGPSRIVVAVLPLENLSGDPSKDYLGAGVAETLTMALSKVSTLTVLSRAEVLDAVRRGRDIKKVAADLDATFMVDGSVQQAGDRLRVTLRVVGRDGTVAWSDAYEDTAAAVFALHRTMAADIVDKVQGRTIGPVDLTVPTTTNVEALMAYWQARSTLDRAVSKADFTSVALMFRQSIALDAKFALGYAGLADTLWQQYQVTRDTALTTQALEAGLTALRLDANQPATRVAVATVYQGMGQYDAAIDQLNRALVVQPSNDDAHRIYARVLYMQGKPDDALAQMQLAIAFRPRRSINYSELAGFYYRQRRLPEAAATYEKALEMLPNDPRTLVSLGGVYLAMGDAPRSLKLFEQANRIAPTGLALMNMGTAYYSMGRFTQAVDAYSAAAVLDAKSLVLHGNLGDTYLRLNRTEDAKSEFTIARSLALEALRVNEKDARTLSRLAAFEAKLGMMADAADHAAQAVSIAPRDPDVRYKQAVVASLAGRDDDALRTLKEALALGYQAADAKADYDLAAIRESAQFAQIIAGQP